MHILSFITTLLAQGFQQKVQYYSFKKDNLKAPYF